MSIPSAPRVLIISAVPLGSNTATGITLSNLFSDWPLDRIAQLYDSPNPEPSRSPAHVYQFKSTDIPFVKFAKKILGSQKPENQRLSEKLLQEAHGPAYSLLGALSDIVPFRLPNDLLAWARTFKPDLIYTLMGSVRFTALSYKLGKALQVPVVPHFMDDWPQTIYTRSLPYAIPRYILQQRLATLLHVSNGGLTIGEDMAMEYGARYKAPFTAFMNCAQISSIPHAMEANSDVVKFGYVGGLHLNRWESLLSVVQALASLQAEGHSIEAHIHTSPKDVNRYRELYMQYAVVKEISSIPSPEVAQKLLSFDVLVHVESFREKDALYTRLSLSTKIPQYLAAGKPIFVFAPPQLSSTRYIVSNNAGVTIAPPADINAIKISLLTLLSNRETRKMLGHNALALAKKNHDMEVEKQRFRKHLTAVASRTKI